LGSPASAADVRAATVHGGEPAALAAVVGVVVGIEEVVVDVEVLVGGAASVGVVVGA
jgi:hypothetical protein